MKKFSLIVLLGLFLVGCSDQTINSEIDSYWESNTYGNNDKVYEEDEESHVARQSIKEAVEEYQKQNLYNEKGIIYRYFEKEDEKEYRHIDVYYEMLNPDMEYEEVVHSNVIQKLNSELLPGITDFITEISNEKEDLAPQAIVRNNNWAIMYPIHLYIDTEEYHFIDPLKIGLNNIKIKDDYLKKLIEKVDDTKFIVHEPVMSDKSVILQLSTPFYYSERDMDVMVNGQYICGGPNMSFRLYIKNKKLEEIHVIMKDSIPNSATAEDLASVVEWVKEEWQADDNTVEALKANINLMLLGNLTKKKGIVGQLQYSYAIKERNAGSGRISEYTLKKL